MTEKLFSEKSASFQFLAYIFSLNLLFLFLINFSPLLAQVHKLPSDGGKGVPGSIPNSFLIGWKGVEGAMGYEYVLSDNPLCFSGCSGDTREAFTTDTFVVEYNLEADKWYYWITRIILSPDDTSHWSLISSFRTENPENSEAKMLSVAPNPIRAPNLTLRLDWAQNPEANQVFLSLYDLNGTIRRQTIFNRAIGLRFEEFSLQVPELPRGIYILKASVNSNQNNLNNQFTIKVIIP